MSPTRDFERLSLYEVLEVERSATKDEIKKAYHNQSRKHHPDRNLNDATGATRRFTHVLEAYETLIDDRKRAEYDRTLRVQARAPQRDASPDPPSQHGPREHSKDNHLGFLILQLFYAIVEWLLCWQISQPPKLRFTYAEYCAKSSLMSKKDPGITMSDIADFLQSTSGKAFDIRNDHDAQGLFRRMEDFFLCLALDERRWGSTREFPMFGCAHSIWTRQDWVWDPKFAELVSSSAVHEVDAFYRFWSQFETTKTFEWVSAPCGANDRLQHQLKVQRAAQALARQQYNAAIRMMVKALMKADPRYAIHLLRVTDKRRHDIDDLEQSRNPANATSKPKGKRSRKMTGNRKTRKRT